MLNDNPDYQKTLKWCKELLEKGNEKYRILHLTDEEIQKDRCAWKVESILQPNYFGPQWQLFEEDTTRAKEAMFFRFMEDAWDYIKMPSVYNAKKCWVLFNAICDSIKGKEQ